jgi:hypothetical protein
VSEVTRRGAIKLAAAGAALAVGYTKVAAQDDPKKDAPKKGKVKAKLIKQKDKAKKEATKDKAKLTTHNLYVINMTDDQITHSAINEGGFYQIVPPVGRTCAAGMSADQCFEAGHYAPVAATDCPQNVILKLKVVSGGQTYIVTYNQEALDCEYEGSVYVYQ